MNARLYTYDKSSRCIDVGGTATVCRLASGQISDVREMIAKANAAEELLSALRQAKASIHCKACDGSGLLNNDECPECEGKFAYSYRMVCDAVSKAEGRA